MSINVGLNQFAFFSKDYKMSDNIFKKYWDSLASSYIYIYEIYEIYMKYNI